MRYVAVPETATARREHFAPFDDDVETWLTQVRDAAGGKPVIVFTHGYNTLQDDARERMTLIQDGLEAAGYPCLVVLFDWPSDGNPAGYPLDRADARRVAPSFVADGVMQLRRVIPRDRLHLVTHSMGAYLTMKAFGAVQNFDARLAFNEGVFVASDIDQEAMAMGGEGQEVASLWFERFTNYYSTLDRVLNLQTGFVSGKVRAGYDGSPDNTDMAFDDVYCGAQYTSKVPDSEKGLIPSHTFYWSDPGFYSDLAMTLRGEPRSPRTTRRSLQGRPNDMALLT
ncbi:MAG: alpha/beta fold hydrolase [Pseudomonadota bacterium]